MSSPIAHASLAFIVKSKMRDIPLWLLILSTQIIDLLAYIFLFLGIESGGVTEVVLSRGTVYLKQPYHAWSHGLLMGVVWSVLFALIVYLIYRRRRVSIATGLLVFSHWILDFIVYDNLYILFRGSPRIGIGLVTSPVGMIIAIVMELAGAAIIVYYIVRRKKLLFKNQCSESVQAPK